jgi:hypothetical protein
MEKKILCAANWYKDLKLAKTFDCNVLPVNCDRGLVFCGHRHPHCMYSMISITGLRQCEAGEEIQGFLTNKNRFVTREESAVIHIANGGTLNYSSNRLFSEDLY